MTENPKANILEILEEAKVNSNLLIQINWSNQINGIANKLIEILPSLIRDINEDKVKTYYYSIFEELIKQINFSYIKFTQDYTSYKEIEDTDIGLIGQMVMTSEKLVEIVEFFDQLGYFDNNIVIVGANGSGKTFLTKKFKEIITSKTGIVLPAQKILIIPSFKGVLNPITTKENIDILHKKDRDSRTTYNPSKENSVPYDYMNSSGTEFKILLENLLSENNELVHRMRASGKLGDLVDYNEKSKLDQVFEIWNFLIEHRTIKCDNGINIMLESSDNNIDPYDIYQMSDGEKVVLYNIAHVIQAPQDGIIIVDEPEMFLHKTIINKLWDKLEQERPDCLFIYLTHDLDFASSRASSSKSWIKSFEYNKIRKNHKWELISIEDNEIPEDLLMLILGSRKKILFCEGDESRSIDKKVFEILFPNLTITPVKGCKKVIEYTKAYNDLPDRNHEAIGIIDKDFRDQTQLDRLKTNKIHSFQVAEIENLFLDRTFLNLFAEKYDHSRTLIQDIEQKTIKELSDKKEMQVSNYVSSKINYYFSESHVSKGNDLLDIKKQYEEFTKEVDIDEWHRERTEFIDNIISNKNYDEAIKVFNDKGLVKFVNECFSMRNYRDRALSFLQGSAQAQDELRKHFPAVLTNS